MDTKTLLAEHYLEYQRQHGIATRSAFARYLGINESTLSMWLNGHRKNPNLLLVNRLARATGDLRFYDAANLPRPDPNLFHITVRWENLTPDQRRDVRRMVDRLLAQTPSSDDK